MTSTVDDTMLDEEWLAAPRKRSRLRLVMVSTLIAAVCFLGGALTQKNLGVDDAAATTDVGGLPAGLPEGFPTGGFPGTDPQGAATSTPADADAEEQVIGTVIEKNGDVWVVEDLGGTRHDIAVGDDTQVAREVELTPSRVRSGDRVQITGVAGAGQLQASDITLR